MKAFPFFEGDPPWRAIWRAARVAVKYRERRKPDYLATLDPQAWDRVVAMVDDREKSSKIDARSPLNGLTSRPWRAGIHWDLEKLNYGATEIRWRACFIPWKGARP